MKIVYNRFDDYKMITPKYRMTTIVFFKNFFGFKGTVSLIKAMNVAGKSYEETSKKSKKPYVFVSMLPLLNRIKNRGICVKFLSLLLKKAEREIDRFFLLQMQN